MNRPSRFRPFARRRWDRARAESMAQADAEQWMFNLWQLGEQRGDHRFDLGIITQDGYQGGMDADLARTLGL